MAAIRLASVISCPTCGHRAQEQMPTEACQFLYDCKGCGERLQRRPGDCCVFCSYGDTPCPPVQIAEAAAADMRQGANGARSRGN